MIEYKVFASDPFNQSSTRNGYIILNPDERFIIWAVNNGYKKDIAAPFFENKLVKELFTKNDFEDLMQILDFAQKNGTAPPKNLLI